MANVLVLTYWSYADALIQSYTLPYVRMIRTILPAEDSLYVVTLEKDQQTDHGTVLERMRGEGLQWLPLRYVPFGPAAFWMWIRAIIKLTTIVRREKIDVVHCWCTPPGAIGYILSVLTGRRLIIDSYEPHAEAMVENGTWPRNGLAHRLLFWLEKRQSQKAEAVVSVTEGMKQYARERYGVDIKRFFVKPACVDLELFGQEKIKQPSILSELGLVDKIVGVYAGKFGGIYLDQEIFDFFAVAAKYWGPSFRALLLTNADRRITELYCHAANLNPEVVITRFVPYHQVAAYMGAADFALTFVRPVPSKRYCSPIKDGEYWALGLPVVIPAGISDDADIIEKNAIGAVLNELNDSAYFRAIEIINNLINEPQIRSRIRTTAERYRDYALAKKVYSQLYEDIKS